MRIAVLLMLFGVSACSTIPIEDRLWAQAIASGEDADYERYHEYMDRKEEQQRKAKLIQRCVRSGGQWYIAYPLTPLQGMCVRRSQF
jgi:hypothetical protein